MTSEAEILLLKKKRRKLEKRIDEQESFIRNFTQLLEEGEDNLARVQPYLALDEYGGKTTPSPAAVTSAVSTSTGRTCSRR